jgi:hypothetical protein
MIFNLADLQNETQKATSRITLLTCHPSLTMLRYLALSLLIVSSSAFVPAPLRTFASTKVRTKIENRTLPIATDTLNTQNSYFFPSTSKQVSLSKEVVTESVANKYFQLEELEDADKAVTELYLNGDNSVTVGETDGPFFASAEGSWSQTEEQFKLTLTRTYKAGSEPKTFTDIGEFTFSVERVLTGTLYRVGAKLAVQGSIHSIDEYGDNEVGFFEMIDVTQERENREKA